MGPISDGGNDQDGERDRRGYRTGGVAMDARGYLRLSETTSNVSLVAGFCLCILGFNPLLDLRQRRYLSWVHKRSIQGDWLLQWVEP